MNANLLECKGDNVDFVVGNKTNFVQAVQGLSCVKERAFTWFTLKLSMQQRFGCDVTHRS